MAWVGPVQCEGDEDAEGKVLAPTKRNFHTSTVVGNA